MGESCCDPLAYADVSANGELYTNVNPNSDLHAHLNLNSNSDTDFYAYPNCTSCDSLCRRG